MIAPQLFLSVILSFAINLGLAIIGEGGTDAFFAHVPLIVLTVVLVIASAAALCSQGNLSSGDKEDRSNRWVIAIFGVIGLLISYLSPYTDAQNILTFGDDEVRWLGVSFFAIGCALRLWPVFILGKRFSGFVAIQPGHELVTDGIYRAIRNPSYLGLLVSSLGWVLAFRSLVGVALVACLLPPLIARIHSEERLLGAYFGPAYAAYRARTWRLVPGIY